MGFFSWKKSIAQTFELSLDGRAMILVWCYCDGRFIQWDMTTVLGRIILMACLKLCIILWLSFFFLVRMINVIHLPISRSVAARTFSGNSVYHCFSLSIFSFLFSCNDKISSKTIWHLLINHDWFWTAIAILTAQKKTYWMEKIYIWYFANTICPSIARNATECQIGDDYRRLFQPKVAIKSA